MGGIGVGLALSLVVVVVVNGALNGFSKGAGCVAFLFLMPTLAFTLRLGCVLVILKAYRGCVGVK